MKKIFTICAAVATLCACSENTDLAPTVEESTATKTFTISAALSMGDAPDTNDTRITVSNPEATDTWNYKWEVDDNVYMKYSYSDDGGSTTGYTNLTTTLTADNFTGDDYTTANVDFSLKYGNERTIYDNPIILTSGNSGNGTNSFTYNVSYQDGELNTRTSSGTSTTRGVPMISELLIIDFDKEDAGAQTTYSKSINPKLYHVGSVLQLNISTELDSSVLGDDVYISKVTVSDVNYKGYVYIEDSGDYVAYTGVDDNGDFLQGKTKGSITVTPASTIDTTGSALRADGGVTMNVCILPTLLAADYELVVEVILSNGDKYSYTKSFETDTQLKRATVYPINIDIAN